MFLCSIFTAVKLVSHIFQGYVNVRSLSLKSATMLTFFLLSIGTPLTSMDVLELAGD